MKILVAFEESQAVTIELRKLGYEAYSCDLLDCSGGHPEWHIKCDAIEELYSYKYDIAICFPPCTHLAVSGGAHFKKKRADGRQQQGIDLFMKVIKSPIDKICVENPIGIMSEIYRKPDQIIQPYQYGHAESKATCLWLKNLNKLEETNNVKVKWRLLPKNIAQRLHYLPPTPDRSKLRSKTYPGIAKAMAYQFTQPLKQQKLNL